MNAAVLKSYNWLIDCDHQRAYCSSPRRYVRVDSHGDEDDENSWLFRPSSLAVLPAETSGSE
jgi:hypothetical protein